MKKRILRVFLGLILLVVVALVVTVVFIDSIARKGIEAASTYALGVDTTLESASIGLTSGKFGISKLNVANPKGYERSDHFMSLGSAGMEVSLGTLMEDTVRVPKLELNDIHVVIEPKDSRALTAGEDSKYNYEVILDNLKRLSDEDKKEPAADTPKEEPTKHFVIDSIVLKNISVDAHYQIGTQDMRSVKANIPEVKMSFSTKEGATVEELTSLILQTILRTIAENLGDVLPSVIIDGLFEGVAAIGDLASFGVDVVDGAGSVIFDAAKGITSIFGGTGDGALEGTEKAVEGVGEAANKAVEGVANVGEGIGKSVKDVGEGVGEGINKAKEGIGRLLGGDKKK